MELKKISGSISDHLLSSSESKCIVIIIKPPNNTACVVMVAIKLYFKCLSAQVLFIYLTRVLRISL